MCVVPTKSTRRAVLSLFYRLIQPIELLGFFKSPHEAGEENCRRRATDRVDSRTQRATDRVLNPPERGSKIVRDRGSGSSALASPSWVTDLFCRGLHRH